MKHDSIESIVAIAQRSGYAEASKASFKSRALAYLRAIAKDLQLSKGSYSIRFNPGGIAVSGDAILHSDSFYLTIGESGLMYRTCKGQKDYHGGPNCWMVGPYGNVSRYSRDVLLKELRGMMNSPCKPAPSLLYPL